MIVKHGEIYLDESHIVALRVEPVYVRKRYFAVARTLAPGPFRAVRKRAAEMLGLCLRQLQRIVKRYKDEGIPGLRFRSRRPKTSPNKTPGGIENQILEVRKASGFSSKDIAVLVNESNRREDKAERVWPSTVGNILVRGGEIEREHRIQTEHQFFEWGHPNRLIQADLTKFNGVNILTMEDDNSRKGWALALKDAKDKTVINGMKQLVKNKYDNLLTDNGSQFSRKNSEMRKYCDNFINEKHIWTSVHHPQTMGKLSAYQKGLKRFLRHQMRQSRNIQQINRWIRVYNHWYNHGRKHSTTRTTPEARYTGQPNPTWYKTLVKALKLEGTLTVTQ